MKRRVVQVAAATLGTGVVLATAALATPSTADAAGKSLYGCPSGAVCIYPTKGGLSAGPERGEVFFSYGAHNLTNQFGKHRIVNNQYGGAGFRVCYGYGGHTCSVVVRGHGAYDPYDLTKINSFVLVR